MIDVERTIISQYGNSPILVQLIQNMNEAIDPQTDFDQFYDYVWNVMTAQGFGLDIWGRIVGVSRYLSVPVYGLFFGFETLTPSYYPFNEQPFYTAGQPTSGSYVYTLLDDPYRALILAKALANITNCTAQNLNKLLTNLFAGRGTVYVVDNLDMSITLTFDFPLLPYEIAILTSSGAILHPAGVSVSIVSP